MSAMDRLGLAASFVVTVAASSGCRDNKGPDGPGGDGSYSPASLFENGAGECFYMAGHGCPANATCNPPPPSPAECPADMRDGPRTDPHAAEKPGWVRIKESFGAYRGTCSFTPDYFCPRPGKTEGQCEQPQYVEVSCREMPRDADAGSPEGLPEGGQPGWHWVESFRAQRAGGICVRYEAFWCEPGCEPPAGTLVDCKTGAPLGGASATASASAAASASASALPDQGVLNPKDGKGRYIRSAGKGRCYVELPFPPLEPGETRYPGTPPPAESVACPSVMAEAAFRQCISGTVEKKADVCTCHVMGNPPPPPREVPCP